MLGKQFFYDAVGFGGYSSKAGGEIADCRDVLPVVAGAAAISKHPFCVSTAQPLQCVLERVDFLPCRASQNMGEKQERREREKVVHFLRLGQRVCVYVCVLGNREKKMQRERKRKPKADKSKNGDAHSVAKQNWCGDISDSYESIQPAPVSCCL